MNATRTMWSHQLLCLPQRKSQVPLLVMSSLIMSLPLWLYGLAICLQKLGRRGSISGQNWSMTNFSSLVDDHIVNSSHYFLSQNKINFLMKIRVPLFRSKYFYVYDMKGGRSTNMIKFWIIYSFPYYAVILPHRQQYNCDKELCSYRWRAFLFPFLILLLCLLEWLVSCLAGVIVSDNIEDPFIAEDVEPFRSLVSISLLPSDSLLLSTEIFYLEISVAQYWMPEFNAFTFLLGAFVSKPTHCCHRRDWGFWEEALSFFEFAISLVTGTGFVAG